MIQPYLDELSKIASIENFEVRCDESSINDGTLKVDVTVRLPVSVSYIKLDAVILNDEDESVFGRIIE